MKRSLPLIVLFFTLIIAPTLLAQDTRLQVVATTSIIADVARNVGRDLVEVTALVPPDTDSHAFQPSSQDAVMIEGADVVLVNGAGLEEGLLQLVENTASVDLTVVSHGAAVLGVGEAHQDEETDTDHEEHGAAESIGILGEDAACENEEAHEEQSEADANDHDEEHEHGACDPHFWGDPHNVEIWAQNIADAFTVVDPANAETYQANASAYIEQLEALDAELEALFATLPESERLIVTNHNFLSYFVTRYGFEVVGTVIPSVSSLAEPSPQDVADLIGVIEQEGVSAIFAEVSDTSALAQVVARDAGDVTVATLYSESLSASDGPAPTYLDYMRANAQTIVDALANN